jgi:NAD(P)-dependent dehydrogenase (short-subunit alcohol dehydrogenase family)
MLGTSLSPSANSPASLATLIARLKANMQQFDLRFPTVGQEAHYVLTENEHCLSGFWIGLLWQAYAASGEACFKEHALMKLLPSFRERLDKRIHITHDLGFLFTLSARPAWQLLQDTTARDLALRAARELAARFRPEGQYIQAWGHVGADDEGGRTIIDTMMNVVMVEQGGGKVINIDSMLSYQGGILVPSYTAAKSVVAGLTRALANEWAAQGINVNAIAPGYMATDNTAPLRADEQRNAAILARIPAARWGEPADLKGIAVFLASDAANYIHGSIVPVDGGWLAR